VQGAASEKLIIEGADCAVRLCSERVAERKREAAGGNAFALVGGAATSTLSCRSAPTRLEVRQRPRQSAQTSIR
jgi:hypothetical protein